MDDVTSPSEITLTSELRAIGIDRQYRRAAERGDVVRLHRGAFVPAAHWNGLDPTTRYAVRVIAAALASRTRPTVSHASAAALWGVPLVGPLPRLIHVLSSPSAGTRTEGAFRRHATAYLHFGVEQLGDIRRTTFVRTIVEHVATSSFAAGVAALDWALVASTRHRPKKSTTADELIDCADELQLNRGRKAFDRALSFADPLAGSPGESLSRAFIHELGFPPPILQAEFADRRGRIGIVDFWWPGHNLIGEFDGVAKYVREEYAKGIPIADIVMAEKARENRLRATGPRVTRWDWPVLSTPRQFFTQLADAGLPSSRRTAHR